MWLYFGIFLFKIIHDALATLRLIVVSNGKKVLGAILQFICTIIWVMLSGSVLINVNENPGKVIIFAIGALSGSYLGSFIEEKLALGTNLFIIKTKEENISPLINVLRNYNFTIFNYNQNFIFVTCKRSLRRKIVNIIHSFDKDALIICEKIKLF